MKEICSYNKASIWFNPIADALFWMFLALWNSCQYLISNATQAWFLGGDCVVRGLASERSDSAVKGLDSGQEDGGNDKKTFQISVRTWVQIPTPTEKYKSVILLLRGERDRDEDSRSFLPGNKNEELNQWALSSVKDPVPKNKEDTRHQYLVSTGTHMRVLLCEHAHTRGHMHTHAPLSHLHTHEHTLKQHSLTHTYTHTQDFWKGENCVLISAIMVTWIYGGHYLLSCWDLRPFPMERTQALCGKFDHTLVAKAIVGEPITIILLNGHALKLSPKYSDLDPWFCSALRFAHRFFLL